MIPGSATPLLLSNQDTGYKIDRSLRFNSADSAYLSRTPSSAGNRKTWTLSFWIKKHRNGGNPQQIFGQYRGNTPEAQNRFQLYFDGSTDKLEIHTFSLTHLKTDRVFRDNSAWYHIVLAVDTTLSTANNRIRLYVNGAEETSFATRNNPSQNLDLGINTDGEINIGTAPNAKSTYYADVNLANIDFIDGQALAASDFGEFNADNNVWQPKGFEGNYTTSGVSFDFLEQEIYASGTREALFDGSTSTYMSVRKTTASSSSTAPSNTKRIKITFPTPKTGVTKLRVYGGGNTSSMNKVWYNEDESTMITNNDPVGWKTVYTGSAITINSISVGTSDGGSNLRAIEINDVVLTDAVEQGINSFHLDFSDNSSNAALGTDTSSKNNNFTVNNLIGPSGSTPTTPGSGYNDNTLGYYLNNNPPLFLTRQPSGTNRGDQITHGSSTGTTWAVNDVLQWAIDWNGGKIWFGRNNVWYSGNPLTGTNPSVSSVTNQTLYLALAYNSPNFELQVPSSASYTLPTGFSYWGGATLGTWKVSGTNQGGAPDIFSTPIPTSGKIYIEAIIKGGLGTYANVGLMNVGETVLDTDSFIDTPTNYDDGTNVGGNYATFNPLDSQSQLTLSNGNLQITKSSSGGDRGSFLTIGPTSGKFYWEVTFTSTASGMYVGLAKKGRVRIGTGIWSGGVDAYMYNGSLGTKHGQNNGGGGVSYGDTFGVNDVIGCAVDWDAGDITFYKNGVSQGSAWTGQDFSQYMPAVYGNTNQTPAATLNTGQRPFAHTPPAGYKTLCTTNLSDPTIADGSTAFDVRSGLTAQFTINDLAFEPDLIFAKSTSHSEYWIVADVLRSFVGGLRTNSTNAEGSGAAITNVGATGYQSSNNWFTNGRTYATFNWDAGSSNTTISAGSLNSSLYDQSQTWSAGMKTSTASTTSYITTGRTTSFPSSFTGKEPFNGDLTDFLYGQTGTPGTWIYLEFATALTNVTSISFSTEYSCPNGIIKLNGTDVAVDKSDLAGGFVVVNVTGTIPSSLTEIAIQGVGGSSRLKWIKINGKYLIDAINDSQTWSNSLAGLSGSTITNPPNGFDTDESSYADSTAGFTLDLSGHTFGTGAHTIEVKSGGATSFSVNGSTSLTDPGGGGAKVWTGTHTGELTSLASSATGASVYYIKIDGKYLADPGQNFVTNVPSIATTVRARPESGFSIASYVGTGANGSVAHQLNSPPELVIIKSRTSAFSWVVWHGAFGTASNTDYLLLEGGTGKGAAGSYNFWGNAAPTSSVVNIGTQVSVNNNTADYIGYFFTSIEGYSAFGSYTGNGSADGPFVYTGFKIAWLLIKRTDATKSWQLIDNARSTFNVTDDRLFLDDTGSESSSSNFNLDILSNGFKCRTAHDSTNVSGGTYIYAAFAEHPFKTARAR